MFTYKITYLIGKMETSICPPAFVSAIFPNFNGEPVSLTDTECMVTFETEQTPVDLSPLIRVELLKQ